MCGIAGVWGNKEVESVRGMMALLKHRGPDGEGIAVHDKAVLGHTRLSIIDLQTGAQPISNEDGTIQIVANGEIYNYTKLKEGLNEHHFKTQSDTEVIIHLYEEIGFEVFSRLDGMFTIAMLDDDDLILARDPLGIKSLYYSEQEGNFYFASEIKALLPYCSDIKEFPNGHFYHTRLGFKQYYTVESNIDERGPITEFLPEVYSVFDRAVQKRLMSDVPLGVFLSGGLDSSLTSAFAKKYIEELHSFSVGVKDSLDREYAYQVSETIGSKHHEYILDADEMLKHIPDIIYHLESFDAALVRSSIPNYFLCKLTKEYVTVVLSGEGADELFAGYSYLEDIENDEALDKELLHITNNLHNTNLQRVDRMTMAHGLEGRVPFLDKELVKLAFSIPPAYKMDRKNRKEKLILKETFYNELPKNVINRKKEKFSAGCGSAEELKTKIDKLVSQSDFERQKTLDNGYVLNSKEELYYFRIFQDVFEGKIDLGLVGKSRSL